MPERGRLAVVIDDWGYRKEPIARLERLPGPLNVAVLPRLAYSRLAAKTAARRGFEVLLHCPMAAKGGGHPEAGLLRPGLGLEELRARLEEDFRSVPEAVGLNNHEGSLATEDRPLMDAVAALLKERGVYFLDSLTTPHSVVAAAAKAAGVPWARRCVFLDNVVEADAVRARLGEAVAWAQRRGECIAIGHPHAVTLDVLESLLPSLSKQGVRLVKVSALLKRP